MKITVHAAQKIEEFRAAGVQPCPAYFRVLLETQGCQGVQCSFSFDEKKEGDVELLLEGVKVVVDPFTLQWVGQGTLEFESNPTQSGFLISSHVH